MNHEDAASAGVATLIVDRVFGEAELGQLNDQGWQRFSSRAPLRC